MRKTVSPKPFFVRKKPPKKGDAIQSSNPLARSPRNAFATAYVVAVVVDDFLEPSSDGFRPWVAVCRQWSRRRYRWFLVSWAEWQEGLWTPKQKRKAASSKP